MVNRQRFLRRYRGHIKKAVADAVNKRSITDMERGEKVSIPTRDTNEPVFGHGQGCVRHRIFPGNKEFNTGDKIPRPKGGGGQGAGEGSASNQGEGVEDFSLASLGRKLEEMKRTLPTYSGVKFRVSGFGLEVKELRVWGLGLWRQGCGASCFGN